MLPIWRVLKFSFYLLWFLIPLMITNRIKGYDLQRSLLVRRKFARRAAKAIGLNIDWEGTPPDYPGMFVSNHKSYLDPVVQLCHIPALPVAKAEVSQWPLVGYGAKQTGIVFVKRESSKSRRNTLDAIQKIVNDGFQPLIYPEGTTTGDITSAPFRRGGFRLAAKNGFEIFPVAITYRDQDIPWVGKIPFVKHAMGVFSKKRIDVKVRYGPGIFHPDAQILMETVQDWIDDALVDLHREFEEESFNG